MGENKKPIILFYINAISFGGSGRVLTNLANQFSLKEYMVVFVTTFKYEDEYTLEKNIERVVLEPKAKKGKILKNASRIIKLKKIIKYYKPNSAVSFLPESNFRLLLATRRIKVKTIVSVRNDPRQEYKTLFSKVIAQTLYKKANLIVFQSKEQQGFFGKKIQDKSCIIPNQIDPTFFARKPVRKKNIILSVGRIEKSKNHALIINAFNEIRGLFPFYELHIYGDGSEKKQLLNLINQLDADAQVKIFPSTNEIISKYREAKIFVSASNFEGIPNVLLEAMAIGLPIITTDAEPGGPRLITKNGALGFLIPIGCQDALKEKLILLLKSSELRASMGEKARLGVKDYHPDAVFKLWEEKII